MNSGLMSVEISPGGKALGAALAGERPQLEVNCGLVTLEAVEVTQHLPALRALPALHLLQQKKKLQPVFWIRIRIGIRIHRIHMFKGPLDPDPLVRDMDPDLDPAPDPSIIKQK
jgi:hypothetical protein